MSIVIIYGLGYLLGITGAVFLIGYYSTAYNKPYGLALIWPLLLVFVPVLWALTCVAILGEDLAKRKSK